MMFFVTMLVGRGLGPLAARAIVYAVLTAVVAGTLGGTFLYFKTRYYNQGWAAAISAVAAQDGRAIHAKDEAVSKVHECRDAGRTWNVADGVCE